MILNNKEIEFIRKEINEKTNDINKLNDKIYELVRQRDKYNSESNILEKMLKESYQERYNNSF